MMETAREAAAGQEAVCVSHQLPIWVTLADGRAQAAVAQPDLAANARWAA